MVDLLDQFESAGLRQDGQRRRPQQPVNPFDEHDVGLPAAGLPARRAVRQYKPAEYPIFKRQDAPFTSPQGITHMAVSNGCVTVVQPGNIIRRFSLDNPRAAEYVEIKREGEKIHRVFQDPSGQHLLVCMESKECFYIGSRLPKRSQPKQLTKVKGQLVESVAWNKVDQNEQSTGAILLGTSTGSIFETEITFEESILKPRRSHFTEVYKLMYDQYSDPCEPVTGLLMEPFPDRKSKFYILATTPRRIYQFIGAVGRSSDGTVFGDLFAYYDNIKAQFLEIPGSLKDSQLHVWPCYPKQPKSFAWLTGAGVYYGQLGFGDHEPGESLFVEKELIPYTSDHPSEMTPPMGMALTQFHCLLFYRDRVEAICILNQKRVFEDAPNTRRDGPLMGMCVDTTLGSIYTHQRLKVWQYVPHRETRNVWRIFLEQGRYEDAKRYAEGNQEHLDTILNRQAEYYFKERKFHDAAVLFSQSQLSFEEVTLKFIEVNRKDALKTFLLKKLEGLNPKDDSTQQTMLTTWLIELFLNELGSLRDEGTSFSKLQREFHRFLESESLRECLEANRKTVYDLITSHGATDDMIFFACLMRDYEKVITHCIQGYDYKEALSVLTKNAKESLKAPENERRARFRRFEGLFYKFSPALMRHCPEQTVKAWIDMDRLLDPKKLIPSLIQCNAPEEEMQTLTSAAIQYLEFCVHKLHNRERAIHNFLVSSYAQSKDAGDRSKLLAYLQEQSKYPTVCYDPQYALRLCMEHKLDEPCVHIYAAMGLYEESVELALKVDVELARSIANIPLKNKDLQKRLWLKIAEHVIKKENNIEKAMQFLQECTLLKIEDILPCFPDFVTIEHFKDAICSSLTDYNAHIDDLKSEMQGATDSAKNIRSDIQDIRNKCVVIQSDARCQICEGRLLTQAFYMFPCRHAFHRDCLTQEVKRYLSEEQRRQLDQWLSAVSAHAVSAEGEGMSGRSGLDEIKAQINSVVGTECLYCGDRMIETIDLPFIPPLEMNRALASWR